jgi:hypothetical protein
MIEPKSCGVLDTPLSRGMHLTHAGAISGRAFAYSAANTAFAISAVPLWPPNSIGLMPSA